MTSELDSPRLGATERARNRRFYVEVTLAVVLAVAASLVPGLARRLGAPEALQLAAAFLPLAPMAWGVVAVVRLILRSDEWERRVYLVSASIAFLATMVTAFLLNALALAGAALPLGGWWAVILVGSLTMFIAIWVRSRR